MGMRSTNYHTIHRVGFPGGTSGKKPTYQCRRYKRRGFDPWVRKIPWRQTWQPTPAVFFGESHGQTVLAGWSLWGHKESDIIEKLHFHFHQHERLPRWHSGKVSTCQDEMQKTQFRSLSWEDLWRRKWRPTPIFLCRKPHGQRSLVGCNP